MCQRRGEPFSCKTFVYVPVMHTSEGQEHGVAVQYLYVRFSLNRSINTLYYFIIQ